MNKKYKNCLYIFVSALFIGANGYLCSTNALADGDNQIAQVAKTNSQTDILANVEQGYWGECPWKYDSASKTLTLGESGKTFNGGTVPNPETEGYLNVSPFNDIFVSGCQHVIIAGEVILKGNMSMLFGTVFHNEIQDFQGLDKLNTTGVTNMSMMFREGNAKTIDVSKFDMANVTDISGMFGNSPNLTELDVSRFNTVKATNMSQMFMGCPKLRVLDVSNFNTAQVTDMSNMFLGCLTVEKLDVTNWDTAKVTDMSEMFGNCLELRQLNFSNWDTRAVKYASYFFSGAPNNLWCISLGKNVTPLVFGQLQNARYHEKGTPIPDSTPIRYANGSGWRAVQSNGIPSLGTPNNPQGNIFSFDDFIKNPLYGTDNGPETYVWQQESTPITKQNVTIEYLDANTGKSIPGVKAKVSTDYSGKPYDVTGADSRPDISGYTWDGKTPTNAKGVYGDKDIVVQYVYNKNSTPSTPGTPTNPGNNNSQTVTSSTGSSSSSASSSSDSSQSTPTTPNTAPKPSTLVGPNIAVKGEAVYATKKIGLYKNVNFKKSQRIAWYTKQKRINRPMFVVTGYKRTSNGTLRYKVRDVNHDRKTDGKTGYITASRKYVVPVYYASVPKSKKITVIVKKGINTYKSASLTGKVKHYKKGTRLTVKKLVKHNLTTRYQLSNGNYATANKKLIIAGNY
ncbi:BspA family leucine-rich repeat surface protein [Lentilactobacillus hilgardii]|nr:BspA family leucine-rich repeat surface protein [Lentilactobacillus hilgardii]MCV3739970.1 BspA family leucine-rich repeat surface protein [Lentilactobacillus hilgardii]